MNKKVILLCAVLAFGCKDKELEQKRADYIKNCKEEMFSFVKRYGVKVPDEVVDKHCDCSADMVFEALSKKYTEEEIKNYDLNDPKNESEVTSMLRPCISEFVDDIRKYEMIELDSIKKEESIKTDTIKKE